eukprot:12756761-Alexandrium_andersonii.AAC.1
MGPSSPARSIGRSAAGACSAGSSAADPSKSAITAEMFSRQDPPNLAACQAESSHRDSLAEPPQRGGRHEGP